VVGVARIKESRDGIQLGPPKVLYLGPLDAGRNDGEPSETRANMSELIAAADEIDVLNAPIDVPSRV